MTKFLCQRLTWAQLRGFGNVRFLQVSYLALIAVPLLAGIRDTPFSVFMSDLPITMRVGYFASLFLSVAHMVYQGWCPNLIKRFDSPNDLYRQMLEIKALQVVNAPGDVFEADLEHCQDGFNSASERHHNPRLVCQVLYYVSISLVTLIVLIRTIEVLPLPSTGPRESLSLSFASASHALGLDEQLRFRAFVLRTDDRRSVYRVTGYADRVGREKANLDLARRRAESVVEQLHRLRIDPARVLVWAAGEDDLPLPTDDGVSEPANRVVQILMQ